ncbi:hypothetical protein K504DRAFT_502550 [Pleomassaria siparia CBS 279.74]|uniref:Uncharacterized protein n=1 Tax=Pleomassaria siparia CBS 279.74 TaxID=1314801 RepID=A0A6G1KBJ8_9PLEO|nr:hypothetical protein K504DRAFT_502550 [Pleomassaria siparia CBS 279.74]
MGVKWWGKLVFGSAAEPRAEEAKTINLTRASSEGLRQCKPTSLTTRHVRPVAIVGLWILGDPALSELRSIRSLVADFSSSQEMAGVSFPGKTVNATDGRSPNTDDRALIQLFSSTPNTGDRALTRITSSQPPPTDDDVLIQPFSSIVPSLDPGDRALIQLCSSNFPTNAARSTPNEPSSSALQPHLSFARLYMFTTTLRGDSAPWERHDA